MTRREFIQATAAGGVITLGAQDTRPAQAAAGGLVSPGCRGSKVKLARLFIGVPAAHYPNPKIELTAERRDFEAKFAAFADQLTDVEFVLDELVGKPQQIEALAGRLKEVDGILAVHLSLHTLPVFRKILEIGRPTVIFSAPYTGHEWYQLSQIRRTELGRRMECILSTDHAELVRAVRPIRALHHLREARIVNVSKAHSPAGYPEDLERKFGTKVDLVGRDAVLAAYESVSDADARAEAQRWTSGATAVVEPSADEILKSSRLALALQRVMDEHQATIVTVDCYGSMWRQLPAYPCIGFARLNDLGYGGICQSDLPCAAVHILFQGLTGRPSFVCNPSFDFSTNTATLIHCLGCTRMGGLDQPPAPYKLRDVMERQEGCAVQVTMRTGQAVTQAMLDGMSGLRYFTGNITGAPETERGCRTKIAVKVDGSAETLWQNWSAGIHRVSCYGDLAVDLGRFCRFADLKLINEAV